ncbi:MAG TPA: hypothetical protein VHA78_00425 [Candidatus Peribacteraceae bacterium]|nr:hypothetical protein [Candidatus Peribacteraceae bacterium]
MTPLPLNNTSGNSHYHRLKIGVMGSASGPQTLDAEARAKARKIGEEIGKRGHIFINGACPGLPNDALIGCKESGGFSIGISPAFSEYQHVHEYLSPHDHDMIIFTGMGFMERDIINIRSADGVVIIGGGIGTLNELTIAYDEGRPIGVVTGSGGISDSIPHVIEELCKRSIPPNMVFDDDPVKLLDKLETAIRAFPLPIREDGRVVDKREGRG